MADELPGLEHTGRCLTAPNIRWLSDLGRRGSGHLERLRQHQLVREHGPLVHDRRRHPSSSNTDNVVCIWLARVHRVRFGHEPGHLENPQPPVRIQPDLHLIQRPAALWRRAARDIRAAARTSSPLQPVWPRSRRRHRARWLPVRNHAAARTESVIVDSRHRGATDSSAVKGRDNASASERRHNSDYLLRVIMSLSKTRLAASLSVLAVASIGVVHAVQTRPARPPRGRPV